MCSHFTLWEAALLAALLAPTDAALGQSVVGSRDVPVRVGQAINVESFLNDGIALPALLVFAALASMGAETSGVGQWLTFFLAQVTIGALTGVIEEKSRQKMPDHVESSTKKYSHFTAYGAVWLRPKEEQTTDLGHKKGVESL